MSIQTQGALEPGWRGGMEPGWRGALEPGWRVGAQTRKAAPAGRGPWKAMPEIWADTAGRQCSGGPGLICNDNHLTGSSNMLCKWTDTNVNGQMKPTLW